VPLILRPFFLALQFLTRLPAPGRFARVDEDLGRAAAFFPFVGIIVGSSAAAVFLLTSRVLPVTAAVFLAIVFTVWLTNGLHEDGLADTFDGLGGGWSKDRALAIMRDSRVGTYGALSLIFLILGKVIFLSSLEPQQTWRWLIVAQAASRWTTLPLCVWLPYARDEGQGRLVAKRVGLFGLIAGSGFLTVVLALLSLKAAAIVLLVTMLISFLSGWYYRRRLGGITGDCLGATNQLTEVALYIACLLLTK
jgi:adenosylcobinamide-GDP ribazoletransferase